jgi:DNA-binding transcriptional MerR regulator
MSHHDIFRRILDEHDNVKRVMDAASTQARLFDRADDLRRAAEVISLAQRGAMGGAMAEIKEAMDLRDATVRSIQPVLDGVRVEMEATARSIQPISDSVMAEIKTAMGLRDEMLRSMQRVLDADLPPRAVTPPPLTALVHDTPSQMKRRIEHLEREVQELKDKLNPPPRPPRKDGESSAGGQYL